MAEDEDLFTRTADLTADLREASGARSGELDRLRKHLAAGDGALADPSLARMTLGVLVAAAGTTRFEVPAGSVWLLCRLFDPSAPENGFAGLRIEHGEIELSEPASVQNGRLVLLPGTSITLSDLRSHRQCPPHLTRVMPASCKSQHHARSRW